MPATPAWPPRSAPRLFVAGPLAGGATLTLDGPQAHYLARVMRAAAGDTVILCDDATGEWAARIASVDKRTVTLAIARHLRPREQVPDFWLCPALLRKDRFDLVLEKATELGVRAVRPVITRRCVADRLNPARAMAIVTEAAEQCARTALPRLAEPVALAALLREWPADRLLFFADEQGGAPAAAAFAASREPTSEPPREPRRRLGPQATSRQAEAGPRLRRDSHEAASAPPPPATPAALLTGPEGGFDDAERAQIRLLPQARPVTLGPRTLRGETAAIAATALWMAVAGDWSGDTPPA